MGLVWLEMVGNNNIWYKSVTDLIHFHAFCATSEQNLGYNVRSKGFVISYMRKPQPHLDKHRHYLWAGTCPSHAILEPLESRGNWKLDMPIHVHKSWNDKEAGHIQL